MKKHIMLENINLNEFIDEYVKNSIDFIKRLQEMGYPVQYEFKDDLTYQVLKGLMDLFDISTYSEDGGYTLMNKGFICEYEQSGICYRKSCNRYPEQQCMKSEELLRRLSLVKKQQKTKFKKKRR